MIDQAVLERLNAKSPHERLEALDRVLAKADFPPADPRYINNHIHTTYSFSPYSPTAAAYAARAAGLCTAGIMDHDSLGGAKEFTEAGVRIGIPTTVGIEFRVRMDGTPLSARRTNNPDQAGLSYMTLHAVPHERIDSVQAAFAPLRQMRNARNRLMTDNINACLGAIDEELDIKLDFERDVLPLSLFDEGGTVTERHLMFALARALMENCASAAELLPLLDKLNVPLSEKQRRMLNDTGSPFYHYDLMGLLKSAFVPRVYADAGDECMSLREAVAFGRETGGILCYAYLGDVTDSVTGDKAAQRFEDAYLDELFGLLRDYGVRAVTYMPPRNTRAQLTRLRALCERFGMFEISGEDINSPGQDFVCKAMEDPSFANLIDAAWALIRHERGERLSQ